MKQTRLRATFMRGGTSKALVFHARDLPSDRASWNEIFLAAIGSPDGHGRQLDGMGGGVSSLSKVCVVGPPSRADADIDYTFAQVQVRQARVDYAGNCGNMSSAMGPFAVDEGLVTAAGTTALVRIHNTNTGKIIHSSFDIDAGLAAVDGDLAIPGVTGTGAAVQLDFLDPGGATTGALLPTGNVFDTLQVPGIGAVHASLVDAANAAVFVRAADLGLTGVEMPEALKSAPELLGRLQAVRLAASVAMGIAKTTQEARAIPTVPFIGLVSPAQDARTLAGTTIAASHADLTARVLSSGQPHRALPLTISLCLAVAARVEGSIVHQVTRAGVTPGARLRIAMPSGILDVAADVESIDGRWHARSGSFYRTQRRLFDGYVSLPASRLSMPGAARPVAG